MFELKPDFLIRNEEIGHGLQGIFPYRKHLADDRWAVQLQQAQDQNTMMSIFHGLFLNAKCEHPNIVPVAGFHLEPAQPSGWNIYTKIPRIEQTLKNLIQEYKNAGRSLYDHQVISMFHNVVWGLEHMHKKRIAHRNISSSNIVVDRYKIARFLDMSSAVQPDNDEESETPQGLAGSFLSESGYSGSKQAISLYQEDIWSLGVVIAELCMMKVGVITATLEILEKERAIAETLNGVSIKYGELLANILKSMLDSNPDNRNTAKEVRENLEKYFHSELRRRWEPELEPAKLVETKKGDEEESDIVIAERFSYLGPLKMSVQSAGIREDFIKRKEEYSASKMIPNVINKANMTTSIANSNLEERKENAIDEENSKISTEILDQPAQRHLPEPWRNQFSLELQKEWRIKPIDESQITDQGLDKFMDHLAKNNNFKLSDCQALQLDFSGCFNLSDNGLDKLGICVVQKFKQLKLLSLDLSWCERISDRGVQKFCTSVFQNINNLKDVSIALAECTKITDEGVKDISNHISQNLKELEQLSLNFYECSEIGDEGLQHLGRKLTKNKKLQKLALRFNGCTKITDEALKPLAENIGLHLKDLTALTLDFDQCSQISGDGFARMSSTLFQNKSKLIYLNLNFSKCIKLTDLGLQQFSKNLGRSIKGLHSLTLAFEECLNLTDEGLELLFLEACVPQTELQELNLNFVNCKEITGAGLKLLGDLSKEKNSKFKEVTIYFNGCDRIEEELKNEVRKALGFIRDVDLQ